MMWKAKCLVIISMVVLFLAGVGFAEGPYGPPFDDATAYIQALEDAMDARYGSREAWPQGFDTFLAVAKYYSGVETSYDSTLSWATAELQAMEAKAVSDVTDWEAAFDFLYALNEALDPSDLPRFAWPYEAHALSAAAYTYTGTTFYDILPSENDLPEGEAIAIAKEAIQKEYGITDFGINQHEINTTFCREAVEGTPFWRVITRLNEQGSEFHYAYIASPTGEVLFVTRNDGNG